MFSVGFDRPTGFMRQSLPPSPLVTSQHATETQWLRERRWRLVVWFLKRVSERPSDVLVALLPAVMSSLLLFLLLLTLGRASALEFRYHNNREIEEYLVRVSGANPDVTHLYSIGQSVRGEAAPVCLSVCVSWCHNYNSHDVITFCVISVIRDSRRGLFNLGEDLIWLITQKHTHAHTHTNKHT